MWESLAAEFSLVALDLPGFGLSEGDPALMAPRAMGKFVVRFAAALGLERPHGIGPDIGTSALLCAAADHPETFASLVVGAGAATFPLHIDGLLKLRGGAHPGAFPGPGPGRGDRGRNVLDQELRRAGNRSRRLPRLLRGDRFAESIAYVRHYPADLEVLSLLLPTLSTPVQVVVGRDDPYALAEDAEILHSLLPHSRLDILATGHCAWEEDPSQYAAIVSDWVSGTFLKV